MTCQNHRNASGAELYDIVPLELDVANTSASPLYGRLADVEATRLPVLFTGSRTRKDGGMVSTVGGHPSVWEAYLMAKDLGFQRDYDG